MSMPMKKKWFRMAAKLLRTERKPNSNHHLAGFLFVLADFSFGEADIRYRWPSVRYAWPLCSFFRVLCLIWSDTGALCPSALRVGITASLIISSMKHKIFAVLLLGLGVLELPRARGILRARWSGWIFPLSRWRVLPCFFSRAPAECMCSSLSGHAADPSAAFSFSMAGFGIGLRRAGGNQFKWQPFFSVSSRRC